ncbi:MAG TPA: tetratricopeptide repeat protein [Acidobacteriaceae bacterium]
MKAIPLIGVCCLLYFSSPFVQAQDSSSAAEQYAQAGQQAMAQGRFPEAQANFEKLAAVEPNVAEVHATLAVIDYKLRNYDNAVKEIRTALKLKPGLPKLDSLLGLSYAELGRFKEALPGLEKGFKQTADPEVRRMCGLQLLRAYTNLDRDPDAVETALTLNKAFPKDPEVLYHTGRIYGNYAYIVMERLHDEGPNSVWMLQAQGEANEAQKDYESAIVAFNHVLVMEPHRPGIHYRLGRVYIKRFQDQQKPEDREAAIREYTAELANDPGNGNAAYELANLAAETGDYDAARKAYASVVERFPDFEEALVGYAGVLLQTQSAKDAVAPLKHATELRPDDQVAWYRLAMADRATGDRAGAQAAMQKFRTLHDADQSLGLRKPSESDVTPQTVGANPE